MLVKVNFFKPSGKWYTDKTIEIPLEAAPRDFDMYLPSERLCDMVAVTEGDTPWGYPSLSTAGSARGTCFCGCCLAKK